MCLEIVYLMYMYKKDLALNNLQWLICYKIKPSFGSGSITHCLSWAEVTLPEPIPLHVHS